MKIFWQLKATAQYVNFQNNTDIHDVRIHPTKEAAENAVPDFLDRIHKRNITFPLYEVKNVQVEVLDLKLVEERPSNLKEHFAADRLNINEQRLD